MLRLKELELKQINTVFDDIERRLRLAEKAEEPKASGYTMTFVEKTGKFTLTKGDVIITLTKDS